MLLVEFERLASLADELLDGNRLGQLATITRLVHTCVALFADHELIQIIAVIAETYVAALILLYVILLLPYRLEHESVRIVVELRGTLHLL